MKKARNVHLCLLIGLFAFSRSSLAGSADYFGIHVIDDQTGRGLPLVRLTTTNKIRYYTDSNGYVAFSEPGLMDQDVYFDIASWGYEGRSIRLNYRGATVHMAPGIEIDLKIHRKNIAEHLYRLTGDGIYRGITEAESGKAINVVQGTVAWNPYLKKWTLLFGQQGGDSNLGEIRIAFGNAPEGPWRVARKVATHALKNGDNDFYNPTQHPEFMQQGGKIIYFGGTLVTTFSGNPVPTPRYDYNQIMYRIDLSEPRLALPDPPEGLTNTQAARTGQ